MMVYDDETTDWQMIKYALGQRCKYHENYTMGRALRLFYALKCVICILLKRGKDLYGDTEAVDSVAIFNQYPYSSMEWMGTHYRWDELAVGYGIFRNWHYDVYENTSI